MYRSFFHGSLPWRAAAVAGALAWSVLGVAQSAQSGQTAQAETSKVPDAQVEASVLKALAGASDLASQPITTTTVYGVVTLSGSVQTEALRTEAENIVARTIGVQKVIDEMTLTIDGANSQPPQNQNSMPPQDNGAQQNSQAAPDRPQEAENRPYANQSVPPNYPGAPESRQPYDANGQRQTPPPPPAYGQQGNGYPQQQPDSDSTQQQAYGYPQQQPYGPPPNYGPGRQPYGQQQPYGPPQPAYGGQQGGLVVTIPTGALVRIRTNQPLDSGRNQAGQRFDGVVVNDVIADGAVAIPRGAAVEGTVVDAQSSGALKGRGELSLQLTSISLGGKIYPISSDVWAHNGGDKTTETVDKTAIGAGLGGIVGAAAGGGEGAAVGAGVGAAIGLGSSAASGRGQVFIPAEGLLNFHLAQPVTVATVSQMEMDRLSQGAGPAVAAQPRLQRRYPPVYYGPVYYRPYPYYGYPYPYYRYPY